MKMNPLPDLEIHNLIKRELENLSDLPLSLVDTLPEYNEAFGFQAWNYIFNHPGTPVKLKFRFTLISPGKYFCQSSIIKSEKEHFSFDNYLTYELSSDLEDFRIPLDPYQYVEAYLKILKKHLQKGLKDVLLGKKWIDVPFDWKKVGR